MKTVDSHIRNALDIYADKIIDHFKCPLFSYTGQIHPQFLSQFQDKIEELGAMAKSADCPDRLEHRNRLCFVITTVDCRPILTQAFHPNLTRLGTS